VGPLQAQSEKAKKYLVLAQEKRELEISVWLRDMDVARDRLRDLSAKLEMVREQYDRAGEEMDTFDRQIEEIGVQGQLLEVQMDELRRAARAHRDSAAELQQQVAVLRNDAVHNTENAERVRGEIAREDEGGRLIEEALTACRARIAAREQEIAAAERQRVELSEQMQELIPNTVDASGEKHLPVVKHLGDGKIKVEVGSVAHPMTEEHHIVFIYVETERGGIRINLKDKPEAEICVCNEKVVAVYEYCNLHGLWKTVM
jgi:desulfoferrodoxin